MKARYSSQVAKDKFLRTHHKNRKPDRRHLLPIRSRRGISYNRAHSPWLSLPARDSDPMR